MLRNAWYFADNELQKRRQLIVFILIIYIRYWFECTVPAIAPKRDLKLIADLIEYRTINETIANEVLTVFGRHLWYLSETLIGLAFFDRSIDVNIKRLMKTALQNDGNANHLRKAEISMDRVESVDFNLDRFVTSSTFIFFKYLFPREPEVTAYLSFLDIDPSDWFTNASYLQAEEIVNSVKVTNDTAERAIGMMTRYNAKITTNKEEKQMILRVVDEHQKLFPTQ